MTGMPTRSPCCARSEFGFAEAEVDAARPLVPDRDPGARVQLARQTRPVLGREPRPALVVRRAQTLALHPDQPEIAARGAIGDIALIEERHLQPGPDETISDRRADQPAADHDRIETLHPAPATSRSSARS